MVDAIQTMIDKKYVTTLKLAKDEYLSKKFTKITHFNILAEGQMEKHYLEEHLSPDSIFSKELIGVIPQDKFPDVFQSKDVVIFPTVDPFDAYYKCLSDQASLI